MMKKHKYIYIVVFVWGGFSSIVERFYDAEAAYNREKELRKNMRPDYDETGVFQIEI